LFFIMKIRHFLLSQKETLVRDDFLVK